MIGIELKEAIGICITSYEITDKGDQPTLSHIFWGETFDEALNIAKSHLKSDYFFKSTFLGEMPWNGDVIYLTYDGQMLSNQRTKDINVAFNELNQSINKYYKMEKYSKDHKIEKYGKDYIMENYNKNY